MSQSKTPLEKEFGKRRCWNVKVFLGLLLFALALWGMTFFFRLNYIKGLTD